MILVIHTSPVSAFTLQIVNDEGVTIDTCSSTFSNIRNTIDNLAEKYQIEKSIVLGSQSYTTKVIQDLQKYFDFSISN